jgi:hypothetical protein
LFGLTARPRDRRPPINPAVARALIGCEETGRAGLRPDLDRVVDAGARFLVAEGYIGPRGAEAARTFVRRDAKARAWDVFFLFDNRDCDDPHCTLIKVEVGDGLQCKDKGILEL